MSRAEDIAFYVLAALCGICVLVVLGLCVLVVLEPSCEERGGHNVPDGIFFMPTVVGNTTLLLPYPQYRCEGSTK